MVKRKLLYTKEGPFINGTFLAPTFFNQPDVEDDWQQTVVGTKGNNNRGSNSNFGIKGAKPVKIRERKDIERKDIKRPLFISKQFKVER